MVGKKKRGHPDLEELLARPWCYYCKATQLNFNIIAQRLTYPSQASVTLMT